MPAFRWTTDVDEAKSEQRTLRDLVRVDDSSLAPLSFSRGMALGSAYDEKSKRAFAVGVFFNPTGRYSSHEREPLYAAEVDFPYIPGLLAFRVGPALCALLDDHADDVDLLLVDGQGLAHPRGLGLASHIGVLYNKASIGMTRHGLYGQCTEPPRGRFNRNPIKDPRTRTLIGYAVSFGEKCEPCYLSAGHRVTLDDAFRIVCDVAGDKGCFPRPLQRAHAIANARAREFAKDHKY